MVTNSDVMGGGGVGAGSGEFPPPSSVKRGSFDVSLNYWRKETIRCTFLGNNSRLNLIFPLPREARKILRLIKLLEKEDDSLTVFENNSRLSLVFPPPAQSAENFTTY